MVKKLLLLFISVAAMTNGQAASEIWREDQIPWSQSRPNGTKLALLKGDWSIAGTPFTYAFYMPDGAWFPAHRHPADATIVVIKGILLLADGDKIDRAAAQELPAGSIGFVPAGQPHFEGARGETILIGHAVAPWGTEFLSP